MADPRYSFREGTLGIGGVVVLLALIGAACVLTVIVAAAFGAFSGKLARVDDAALLPVVSGIADGMRDPDDCVDVRGGVRLCVWVDDTGTHAVRVVSNRI